MDLVDRLAAALADRYRVERKIGEGGMAAVYLAHDLRHGRAVAIKVLRPDALDEVGRDRFHVEIRTTAGLRHPHILPLFESGEAAGRLFYVTPFVDGESLEARIRRDGPLDVREAVAIAGKVARALDHAHRQGVVHRDVKPANILLQDGEPLVADFGIARLEPRGDDPEGGESGLTRTGQSLGTPGYMSPEQAAGDRSVDARSDVYAVGAVLYAMLTGAPPFAGETPVAAFAKILTEAPPDPSQANPDVPPHLSEVVRRAMAKDPGARFATAAELAAALRPPVPTAPRSPRAPLFAAAGAVAAAAVLASLWIRSTADARWAREEAVPEIQRLLGDGDVARAFALARRALEVLPEDPTVRGLWESTTAAVDLRSAPPGAEVSWRPYDPEDTAWSALGATPLDGIRLPNRELLFRFELEGHHPYSVSRSPGQGTIQATLFAEGPGPPFVEIPAATYGMTGEAVALDTFWIDEREVSNAEYQAFVEEGGYAEMARWADELAADGVAFDPARGRRELVDRTGRPGPAGWEIGRFEPGSDDLPVQGVSWFEAVMYCRARGASLPTFYHWKHADAGEVSAWDGSLRHANLGRGGGPLPVGTSESVGTRGVVDMAGNVREWVWNASRGDRYILGGSWRSPPHMYTDYDATDPWSRSEENGVRCVRYARPPGPALLAPIETPVLDFAEIPPADDATFAGYAAFYEYDPAPLREEREVVSETEDWVRERVTVDAPYLDERLLLHLFLPRNARPPYQTVVYVPGASAFFLTGSENLTEASRLMFVPQSGRALVYPVLKGTYERRHPRPARGDAELRQRYVWMTQDVMRAVDYVEAREDLDGGAVAYMGLSFGAELAVPVALEKRFRAAVLIGAALDPGWVGDVPDEAAPWNFAPRITTPTLVINGRYDFMHPYEESQLPFFEALPLPPEDKRFVVLETGHLPPTNRVIRHALTWLDERLGPVETVRSR